MKMKKTVFTFLAVLLAICACNKPVTPSQDNGKTYSLDKLTFNFTIEREANTKGVRSEWLSGDQVYIFIGGVNSAYLTVTYDGSDWSTDPVPNPDAGSLPSLAESGVLTAVYLPYGNSLTPTFDGTAGAWVFPGTNDYYYMQSQKTTYFITDTGNQLATIGAYLYMETADDYIQFFLPDNDASGTIQLACNYLVPGGIGGVSLDGTITDAASSGVPGRWVTARADTINGDKGYYASGRLIMRAGLHMYFAMNVANTTYKQYYKQRAAALVPHGAYILPTANNWISVSDGDFVEIAGNFWCSVNAGADHPWEEGDTPSAASMDNALETNTIIPSDDEWNILLDRTKVSWVQISIVNIDGFLIIDRANPDNYFFLRSLNYWSTSSTSGTQHYLKTDGNGTHEITSSNPPSTASVRLMSTLHSGSFNPPENGGNI